MCKCLHWIALDCTGLHWIALHSTGLHWIARSWRLPAARAQLCIESQQEADLPLSHWMRITMITRWWWRWLNETLKFFFGRRNYTLKLLQHCINYTLHLISCISRAQFPFCYFVDIYFWCPKLDTNSSFGKSFFSKTQTLSPNLEVFIWPEYSCGPSITLNSVESQLTLTHFTLADEDINSIQNWYL